MIPQIVTSCYINVLPLYTHSYFIYVIYIVFPKLLHSKPQAWCPFTKNMHLFMCFLKASNSLIQPQYNHESQEANTDAMLLPTRGSCWDFTNCQNNVGFSSTKSRPSVASGHHVSLVPFHLKQLLRLALHFMTMTFLRFSLSPSILSDASSWSDSGDALWHKILCFSSLCLKLVSWLFSCFLPAPPLSLTSNVTSSEEASLTTLVNRSLLFSLWQHRAYFLYSTSNTL